MAVSAYYKFDQFVEDLIKGIHDFDADTYKVALSNTLPTAGATYAAIAATEIAAGNGYTAGGNALTLTSVEQTAGVLNAIFQDSTFTATGAFAQFRYAYVYNVTKSALVCWFDYGAAIDMANLESFVVDLNQVTGMFTVT